MSTVIGVVAYAVGATGVAASAGVTAATIGASVVVAGLQVAAVVGSLAYQRSQKKKAKAAAERLRREQAALSKAYLKGLSKLKTGFEEQGGGGPRDVTSMIRKSTATRRMVYGRSRLGGIWVYPETTGSSNETLHLILALCEGPVEEIESVYFDDEEVTLDGAGNGTGKWAGVVVIKKHLGTAGQTAETALTGVSSKWTSAHTMKGIAYLYVRLTINLELFTAIPEISAVVKGKNNILDPRTNLRGYTTNPALCLADYLATPLSGPGVAWADIDSANLINAANVCDEIVTTLSGTEPRYSCQGAIDLGNTVEDNASLFIQSMNGDLIHQGGSFVIQAGEYQTPTFTIDLDMLAGGIELSFLQPRKDRANVVKGTFLSESNAWQRFDFPSITDAAAVTTDGQQVVTDISLELVGSGSQAQRLANMELRQSRRGRTVTLRCNLKAMPARVGSNVMLDIPRYFDGDVFRVVESKWSVGNDGTPGITLTLLENHTDIYAWDGSLERAINVPPPLNAKTPQVATPIITPASGHGTASATITTLTSASAIRWSKSADPVSESSGTLYTAPIDIDIGDMLYARAFRSGYLSSALATGNYAFVGSGALRTPTAGYVVQPDGISIFIIP